MKPHLIHDLLVPFLAAVTFGALAFLFVQMLIVNEAMIHAQKHGVEEIPFQELASTEKMLNRYVKVNGFERNGNFSTDINPKTGNLTVAFVVSAIEKDPVVAEQYPVVVQTFSINDKDVADLAANNSLSGVVTSFMNLNYRHQEFLETQHPEINFDNCYVLTPQPPNGDSSLRMTGFFVFLLGVPAILATISFVRNAWAAREGVEFSPQKDDTPQLQKHVADLSFEARPLQLQSQLPSQPTAESTIAQSEPIAINQTPKADNWLLLKVLKIGSIVLLLLVAATFIFPMIVPTGIEVLLFLLAMGCTGLTCHMYAAAIMAPENHCRIRVAESSLPWMDQRHFRSQRTIAQSNGFEYLTTESTNRVIRQPAQVYRSNDGAIMLQFTKSVMGIQAIAFCTMLANGKVVFTMDIEAPEMKHPLLAFTTGVKGDFAATLSIHRQILNSFSDVIVRVNRDEIDALADYTDQLELLATGRILMYEPKVPPFQDLIQKFNSVSAEPNRVEVGV